MAQYPEWLKLIEDLLREGRESGRAFESRDPSVTHAGERPKPWEPDDMRIIDCNKQYRLAGGSHANP